MTVLRILTIGGSVSGKTNMLMNLIKHQRPNVEKIYLKVKDPFKSKYQLLISGREKVRTKKDKKIQLLIILKQLLMRMKNLEGYNSTKKKKVLMVFVDMIVDMKANKKLSPAVTELFIRGMKLKISLAFISESFSKCLKILGIKAANCFIMKNFNK